MLNIAVVTSKESWFVPRARELVAVLRKQGHAAALFHAYERVPVRYEIVFLLSYFRIVEAVELKKHRVNLVVHESGLPRGKGWAPLFWQILEGKRSIPIVLIEAAAQADSGRIYLKDRIVLEGHELHDEIRREQARKTVSLCVEFINTYPKLKPRAQQGKATFYRRRAPCDSALDVGQSIKAQFDKLRIADNERHPAFFYNKGRKYILKIEKAHDDR